MKPAKKKKTIPVKSIQPAEIPLPGEFLSEMQQLLSPQHYSAFLEAVNKEPSVSVRINCSKPISEDFFYTWQPSAVSWCPAGLYLSSRPSFTLMPEFHAGVFYVQEAASMIHARIASTLFPDKPILAADLCAAPGGKTTAIIDALPQGSVMVANEFVPARAAVLSENIIKWGNENVLVTNSPVKDIHKTGLQFDLVIVDAPCSGEGMMRKEAEARRQWSPALVQQCSSLQREILDEAVEMVKPGGYLVYSTCTFNTLENEQQIERLALVKNLNSVCLDFSDEFGILSQISKENSAYRFIPGITRSEGLFVAVMKRPQSDENHSHEKNRKQTTEKIPSQVVEMAKSLKNADKTEIFRLRDRYLALPADLIPIYKVFDNAGVKIVTAGIELAEMKGNKAVPSPGLALSRQYTPHNFPDFDADTETALKFLRGETLNLPPELPLGYVRVLHHGLGLGWVNNLGTRANNLYPQPWRIRKS